MNATPASVSRATLGDVQTHVQAGPMIEPSRNGREAWRAFAACKGSTALFYPERWEHRRARTAREVCAQCPVRRPCLDAGLHESYGVWGGLSELGRRRYRRRLEQQRSSV